MPRWVWALLLGSLAVLCWVGSRGSVRPATASTSGASFSCPLPPKFSSPDQPLQSEVAGRLPPFRMGDASVSALAGFSLQARVLSREDYSLGRESAYSPTDLALGWGPMSEPGMAKKLHLHQGGRGYHYQWSGDGPPIPLNQIIRNSANMHMVPADTQVARALAGIDEGDTVRIDGWLIRIDADGGWRWQSSLSRDDSGDGACELVLVCSIEKN